MPCTDRDLPTSFGMFRFRGYGTGAGISENSAKVSYLHRLYAVPAENGLGIYLQTPHRHDLRHHPGSGDLASSI